MHSSVAYLVEPGVDCPLRRGNGTPFVGDACVTESLQEVNQGLFLAQSCSLFGQFPEL